MHTAAAEKSCNAIANRKGSSPPFWLPDNKRLTLRVGRFSMPRKKHSKNPASELTGFCFLLYYLAVAVKLVYGVDHRDDVLDRVPHCTMWMELKI